MKNRLNRLFYCNSVLPMGLIVAEDSPATHSACLLLARTAIGVVDIITATCTALAVTMFDKEIGLGRGWEQSSQQKLEYRVIWCLLFLNLHFSVNHEPPFTWVSQ